MSKKSSLSDTFNFQSIFYMATIGFAFAVTGNLFWQSFLDPIFFPVIHDTTNVWAQSWIAFVNDHFGFVTDWLGFTGDGGLLKTEFMQSILAPYMSQVALPSAGDLSLLASPLSLD